MTGFTDRESGKGRVFVIILATLGAMIFVRVAIEAMDAWWIWPRIHELPFWLGLAAVIALWGGVMLVAANALRIVMFAGHMIVRGGQGGAELAGEGFTRAGQRIADAARFIAALLRAEFELLAFWLAPHFAPLVRPLAPLRERLRAHKARMRKKWQEEEELRRAYREQFHRQFKSYSAFKKHFEERRKAGADGRRENHEERKSAGGHEPGTGARGFVGACRILGLPDNGNFTHEDLKARYRALMKGLHPDVAGPNELAGLVNAACDHIKKRKGWS